MYACVSGIRPPPKRWPKTCGAGTIGQPDAGLMSGTDNVIEGGYWSHLSAAPTSTPGPIADADRGLLARAVSFADEHKNTEDRRIITDLIRIQTIFPLRFNAHWTRIDSRFQSR